MLYVSTSISVRTNNIIYKHNSVSLISIIIPLFIILKNYEFRTKRCKKVSMQVQIIAFDYKSLLNPQ